MAAEESRQDEIAKLQELVRRERELHAAKLARLREEVRLALDEVERGEILDVTVDAVFDELMDERRQFSAR